VFQPERRKCFEEIDMAIFFNLSVSLKKYILFRNTVEKPPD